MASLNECVLGALVPKHECRKVTASFPRLLLDDVLALALDHVAQGENHS